MPTAVLLNLVEGKYWIKNTFFMRYVSLYVTNIRSQNPHPPSRTKKCRHCKYLLIIYFTADVITAAAWTIYNNIIIIMHAQVIFDNDYRRSRHTCYTTTGSKLCV